MKPTELSRRVVTESGYTTAIKLPELVKGVETTVHVIHGSDYNRPTAEPVVTTIWITQEKEQHATHTN